MLEAYHKLHPKPKTIAEVKEVLQVIWDSLPQMADLRPISLTPTVSKVLESIVGSWILDVVGSQLATANLVQLKVALQPMH